MAGRIPGKSAGAGASDASEGRAAQGARGPAKGEPAKRNPAAGEPPKQDPAERAGVKRGPVEGEPAKSARLFFALWPSPSMQVALAAAAEPAVLEVLNAGADVASSIGAATARIQAGATRAAAPAGATRVDATAAAPAHAGATATTRVAASPRRVPATNYHLTLAFLGSVPLTRLADLDHVATRFAQAAHVLAPPIDIVLDTLDHWRKPQVLVATASHTPPAAVALAEGLQRALVDAGFTPDLKPFRVHATIARKVRHAGRERHLQPVHWTFDSLHLVESQTNPDGSAYRTVKKWVLDKRD